MPTVSRTKDGRQIKYIVDCIGRTHSRWGCSVGDVATGTPPAIVAEMQIKGSIPPGVWAPEQVLDPESLFAALAKREMQVHVTKMEKIT
jgi:saccharopine dehydrogenase-like NADP-dependent oxidoreductase